MKILCDCAEKENHKLLTERVPAEGSLSPYTQKQQMISRRMGRGQEKAQEAQPQESFSGYCILPQNAYYREPGTSSNTQKA